MKAAMCLHCGQVIGPRPRWQEDRDWTWCADPCAHTAVRWRDGAKGLLEVTSFHGEDGVAVLGLHNAMVGVLAARTSHEGWRNAHARVTDAPGYLFDKTKRNCWAVLVRPGESNDVFFMPYSDVWQLRAALDTPEGDPVCGPLSRCRDALHTDGANHTPKCRGET